MQQVCDTAGPGLKPRTVFLWGTRSVQQAQPSATCHSGSIPAAKEPAGEMSSPSDRGSPRGKFVFTPQTWDAQGQRPCFHHQNGKKLPAGKLCVSSIGLGILGDSVLKGELSRESIPDKRPGGRGAAEARELFLRGSLSIRRGGRRQGPREGHQLLKTTLGLTHVLLTLTTVPGSPRAERKSRGPEAALPQLTVLFPALAPSAFTYLVPP